ncbi:MAG: hypothetical protein ABIT20_12260 [Gemmatimonadaceae bacterium]
MRLTTETARLRWLILSCVWALIAWLAVLDSLAVRDYVALLDDSAVLPTASLPLRRTVPSDYADAQTWVRYALALDSTAAWRIRHTDIDNAPYGRAVHWNSGFAHLVAAAGRVRSATTRETIALATERSLAWVNLPLLLCVIVLFSTLVARHAGAAGGTLIAFGMLGHPQFYAGFAPNNVDHHGLLSAASLGVVLGIVFMGVGWWRPRDDGFSLMPNSPRAARAGAVLSAASGAVGMWISAASVIPTIAFAGGAGLLATWWLGARAGDDGATFDGDLWRLWGRVGASLSLLSYLAEYAPHDVGLRLEVNHPLYALAWLGGGELIAMLVEWRVAKTRPSPWHLVIALAAIAAAPAVIAIEGAVVFVPLDAGIARLHESISEFRTMLSLARSGGLSRYALTLVLVLPAGVVAAQRVRDRLLIAFTAACVAASALLAFWQVRWWLPASGIELCLLLIVVSSLVAARRERTRWIVVAIISAVFVEQAVARIHLTRANVASSAVTIADAAQPLYLDVAAAIRATQPTGDVVLLASPNASAGVAYFGDFKSIGTLYWENADGLRAAAAIFSATTDDEARALMRARGVTHIAMIGQLEFLGPYLELVHPGASRDELKRTFGYRLFQDDSLPRWLRAVPVATREGAAPPELGVRLMQIVPEQSEPDALWHIAIARLAAGDAVVAEQNFRSAIALFPTPQRASMYDAAARLAYASNAHRLALRLFHEALAIAPTTAAKVGVAWILATSPDDSTRDGATAITMMEPLLRLSPNDPALLDVFAAALAETGRFPDAVTTAERLVAIHQRAGDVAARGRAQERLDAYRGGRPWRTR